MRPFVEVMYHKKASYDILINYGKQLCMGSEYDEESCYKYFVPQLLMFFVRFLDIYDRSLEGHLVEDYIKGLPHRMAVCFTLFPFLFLFLSPFRFSPLLFSYSFLSLFLF